MRLWEAKTLPVMMEAHPMPSDRESILLEKSSHNPQRRETIAMDLLKYMCQIFVQHIIIKDPKKLYIVYKVDLG